MENRKRWIDRAFVNAHMKALESKPYPEMISEPTESELWGTDLDAEIRRANFEEV
jgi:hypothetical protein